MMVPIMLLAPAITSRPPKMAAMMRPSRGTTMALPQRACTRFLHPSMAPNSNDAAPSRSPAGSRLQRHGQAKVDETGITERSDLGDRAALDAQHVELESPELGVAGLAQVARRGWHPVRAGGNQPPVAVWLVDERAPQQCTQFVDPGYPHRVRRHRDRDVPGRDRGRGCG